eukprot:9599054-Lingulodinium_polyedra.AAC.1
MAPCQTRMRGRRAISINLCGLGISSGSQRWLRMPTTIRLDNTRAGARRAADVLGMPRKTTTTHVDL